ncbi:hypothetical protein KCP74_16010 [Salmonella enterica subsp. enterica]|nr:hypothetical protein KCP74_16010 [Salmonella enterica subsp. enterica]
MAVCFGLLLGFIGMALMRMSPLMAGSLAGALYISIFSRYAAYRPVNPADRTACANLG